MNNVQRLFIIDFLGVKKIAPFEINFLIQLATFKRYDYQWCYHK